MTDPTAALRTALKAHYRAVGSHGTPGASCGAPECADAIVTILGKRGVALTTLATSQADDPSDHLTSTDQLEAEQRGLPIPYKADDPSGPTVKTTPDPQWPDLAHHCPGCINNEGPAAIEIGYECPGAARSERERIVKAVEGLRGTVYSADQLDAVLAIIDGAS